MIPLILMALATGLLSGMMAGALGLGGGVIVVPTLLFALPYVSHQPWGVSEVVVVSLCSMLVIASSALWAHHKKGSVSWPWVVRLVPAAWVGSWIAQACLLEHLEGVLHRQLFGLFLAITAVRLLVAPEALHARSCAPSATTLLVGFAAGVAASLFGIGGGLLIVPWLHRKGVSGPLNSGTSVACAFLTAAFALFAALVVQKGPLNTWPEWLVLALCVGGAGALSAPWGVVLAHRLPRHRLKQLFSGVLLSVACSLLWAS